MNDQVLKYFIWFSMVLPFLSLCFLFFLINFYFNRKLERLKWDLIIHIGEQISKVYENLGKVQLVNEKPSFSSYKPFTNSQDIESFQKRVSK